MDITETIIGEIIKNRVQNPDNLAQLKRKMARQYKIMCPGNISLLKTYKAMVSAKKISQSAILENLLKIRPIRSLSGIVNVSVLTKPYPCPGKCLYCPSQKGTPKSYLKNEPAVMRAIANKYDPYKQVKMRLAALEATGHPTDKIELRIIGGTWSFYPQKYQAWFIKRCFDACNNEIRKSKTMVAVLRKNETAKHRIIGLSIETRPDFINEKELKRLREFGCTMVELGVQSIYDNILKTNRRGHSVKETIVATKLLKDAGFKVLYQMMPNLPGSDLKRDEKMFAELFTNPDFRPDLLKIYPCVVLKEADIYRWLKNGKHKPYSCEALTELLKKIKLKIPYYVRIQRLIRDIPSQEIMGGCNISNLRQSLTGVCKCIRCREVRGDYNPKEKLYFFSQDYNASGGKEIFLSFENKNRTKLYSLLRLRLTSQNTAIIREIHTYGQSLEVRPPAGSRTSAASPQHRGLGKKLMKEAEKISQKKFKVKKITVISGVGVRGYYRKLGYKLKDTYMVKEL